MEQGAVLWNRAQLVEQGEVLWNRAQLGGTGRSRVEHGTVLWAQYCFSGIYLRYKYTSM